MGVTSEELGDAAALSSRNFNTDHHDRFAGEVTFSHSEFG